MGYLEFCSNCGFKNSFGIIDGNKRFFCKHCNNIHYENPKPTATLICIQNTRILLVKRALAPAKGSWGLPGGFIEKGETPEDGARRELLEETNLKGRVIGLIGTCSHFNTIFGDILCVGMQIHIQDWSTLLAGDDAAEAKMFELEKLPPLAFKCHQTIVDLFIQNYKL